MWSPRLSLYFTIILMTIFSPAHGIEKKPVNIDSAQTSLQSKVAETLRTVNNKCNRHIKQVKEYFSQWQKDFKRINKWLNIAFGSIFYPIVKSIIIAHEFGHASISKLTGYKLLTFYISPNPDGGGYIVSTIPRNTTTKLYELAAGPLAGFTACFAWLKLLNVIQACAGSQNLSLLQALREPLFSEHASLFTFSLMVGLALDQLYSNLVPDNITCEDHFGTEHKGQIVPNDGKQIEATLNHIAPKLGVLYPYLAYALSGAFLCYVWRVKLEILRARYHAQL